MLNSTEIKVLYQRLNSGISKDDICKFFGLTPVELTEVLDTYAKRRKDRNERQRSHIQTYQLTPKGKYRLLSQRAKKQIVPLCSLEEFLQWWSKADHTSCHYCGRVLKVTAGPISVASQTLTRKDSTDGYYPDNMIVCCHQCSRIRNSGVPEEDMLIVGSVLRKNKNLTH